MANGKLTEPQGRLLREMFRKPSVPIEVCKRQIKTFHNLTALGLARDARSPYSDAVLTLAGRRYLIADEILRRMEDR